MALYRYPDRVANLALNYIAEGEEREEKLKTYQCVITGCGQLSRRHVVEAKPV